GAFCVWRLMSENLAAAVAGREGALAVTSALYDSYSALLLYAGSCTPQVYDTVIRSKMKACDPAFSGTWARDYRQVLVRLAEVAPAPGSPLKAAIKFNRLVHMSVAARLVPVGGSLLRDSGREAHAAPSRLEGDLFDTFFLTSRQPVCVHDFVAQLRLLTAKILTDLGQHPVDVRYGRAELNDFQSRIAAHLATPVQVAESLL
ncbi:MAG: L-tyrosine 3-hydroxylase, partial [Kibdelosporangium sp.]